MSDLVGNPEDRFSRVAAHILSTVNAYGLSILKLHNRVSSRQSLLSNMDYYKAEVANPAWHHFFFTS